MEQSYSPLQNHISKRSEYKIPIAAMSCIVLVSLQIPNRSYKTQVNSIESLEVLVNPSSIEPMVGGGSGLGLINTTDLIE